MLIVLKREHNNKQAAFYNPFHVFEVEFTDYIRRREHTGELIKKNSVIERNSGLMEYLWNRYVKILQLSYLNY